MVDLQRELCTRPWTLVRILPKAQHYTVARFCNRQDADDYLRLLRRFIPAAEFEVMFAPPEEEEKGNVMQLNC